MKIQILQMIEGARKARGLTVVIDVFRAFSLECYLMAKHPSRLCPVGAEQTARDLKMRYPEAVLIGERHGVILPGFEYGNSPSQTEVAELEGKMLIHTTSAGTQGIVNASGATEILTGSLVNAAAIARYTKHLMQKKCHWLPWAGKVKRRHRKMYCVPDISKVFWKGPLWIWKRN